MPQAQQQTGSQQVNLHHPDFNVARRMFLGLVGLGGASFGARVAQVSLRHDNCDYEPFSEEDRTLLRALANKGTWAQTKNGFKAQSGGKTVHVAKENDCYLVSIDDSQNHLHHFIVRTMKRGSCPEDATLVAEYDLVAKLHQNAAEQTRRNERGIASR